MGTGTNKWLSLSRVCKIKEKNVPGPKVLCKVMNIKGNLWNLTEEKREKPRT